MDFQRLAGMYVEQNSALTNREITNLPTDVNAVRCLTQAAINVELFTIPLYMTTMYSIQGMHSITGKGNALYLGRRWPGIAPTASPQTANEQACNLVFSVFIQEMLHLQMAANIHNALGKTVNYPDIAAKSGCYIPTVESKAKAASFTSPLLVNQNNGWICYGPDKTEIPHILDLKDLSDPIYSAVKVALGGLDTNSLNLFLLIEEPSDVLASRIKESAKSKYIATQPDGVVGAVPFADWSATSTESQLPQFGTIATMYECLASYLNITYQNGMTLFEVLFDSTSLQQDLFNTEGEGHPMAEFPRMKTVVDAKTANEAKQQIFQLMNAITDQGEGATMKVDPEPVLPQGLVGAPVSSSYQPNFQALQQDYVQYDENGAPLPMSASAHARYFGGVVDHYDRFQQVKGLLESGEITTWADWHNNQENQWAAGDLQTEDFEKNKYKGTLPSAEAVANALNNLKSEGDSSWQEMSRVAAGAIAGITTVLNEFWSNSETGFPFPSMSGSGDRVSICWAVFGKAPDLSLGEYERIPEAKRDYLYHACQGMALMPDPQEESNSCASKEIFHTCRGSNSCKAEGGCGFVQDIDGGGAGCNTLAITASKDGLSAGCPTPTLYSPPADNACATKGGCAVPISASQLFPENGLMPIYQLRPGSTERISNEGVEFKEGDAVYDIAWQAYSKVMSHEGKNPGEKPTTQSDMRLAFPPST
ncbi:ferritin-like protein [Motilimonas sp. E26]|uniref:ferritin-like protein n=1 Tax=Motilimonas sp. E26 TaxID=2865674 RepID=UPI001E51255A|nr:ferritin-like protein [Motilimonas sp. E26]MCE0557898.1 ferritin-like protein [Motilimonas sp. E26]